MSTAFKIRGAAQKEPADKPDKDERTSRERLLTIVLFFSTAATLAICYLIALPFLPALAWALAMAIIAHPIHDSLVQRRHNANLAAALTVAVVAMAVVIPAFFLTQQIVNEAAAGVQAMQSSLNTFRWSDLSAKYPRLTPLWGWLEQRVSWSDTPGGFAQSVAPGISSFLRSSVGTVAQLLITLLFLFYFLRDKVDIIRSLRSLIPLSRQETNEVFQRVEDTIYAVVYGRLFVALVQGILGGVMFWLVDLPAPLLWAVAMSLLALVPGLGAFLVWLPAAIFLAALGRWVEAVILAIWGLLVVSTIDNVLYPVLVGHRIHMHGVLVFIALAGGVLLFGAAGLVLGPAVFAVASALIEVWRRRTVPNT
jgi:predicted PurR-regulated permease PerM